MRIAAIVPEGSPNAHYRVFQPMEELARRGHFVRVWDTTGLPDLRELLEYDVLLAWRVYGAEFARLARAFTDAGKGMVWDNDDDFTSINEHDSRQRRFYGGYNGHRLLRLIVTLMRMSRVVTTPSAALAGRFREASGVDVRVIENYVKSIEEPPKRRWWEREKESERIVIGWVANREHQTDVSRLRLAEPLGRLLDELPNVEVVTIGCKLELESDRYQRIRGVQFEALREHIGRFDVGIAPIADTAFNRARSNIKVKEYAALGIPWVASPIGPYADLGERHGGRLAPDDGWYAALRELVEQARLRRGLSRNGLAWAKGETIAANAHRWEAVLEHAAVQ